MNGLIQKLREDPEIQELKRQCHEITGRWIPFHWDCFSDIEEYKNYMREIIKKKNTTSQ